MKSYCSSSFPSILRTHSSLLDIICSWHSKNTSVEPKQEYKYNCLQKSCKLSLLPEYSGPAKSGALGLSLFSLMVNPRLGTWKILSFPYINISIPCLSHSICHTNFFLPFHIPSHTIPYHCMPWPVVACRKQFVLHDQKIGEISSVLTPF